jgi:hypothetical protein
VFYSKIIHYLHPLSIRPDDFSKCDPFAFKIKALYSRGAHHAHNTAMEHLALLIAALPVSLILVAGAAWWVFRR